MHELKNKTLVDDRFEIIERIGVGGMGVVYKAEQISLKRTVALKLLLPHLLNDENSLARFEVEAQALSTLTHRNISLFYAYGNWHGRAPYIAMEYLDTANLADILADSGGQLSWRRSVRIMRQVAEAVAHAHRSGIVHRDLKPSNIFLLGEDDLVKVTDFGLAKFLSDEGGNHQSLTATGIAIGTPHYMSPEQAKALPVTRSCDIYALGCVMYQCLFGRPPFDGDTMMEVLMHHMETPVRLPSAAELQSVPPDLIKVLETAMAKESTDRFPDMQSMADALARIQESSQKFPDRKIRLPMGRSMPNHRRTPSVLKIVGLLSLLIVPLIVCNHALIGAKGFAYLGACDQADECYRADVDHAQRYSDPLTQTQLLMEQAAMLKRFNRQQRYQDVLEQMSMVFVDAVNTPRFKRWNTEDKRKFLVSGTVAFADWTPQQPYHAATLTPAWLAANKAGLPDESLLWRCLVLLWDRKVEHIPLSHLERVVTRSKELLVAGKAAPYHDLALRYIQREPDWRRKTPQEIDQMSRTLKQTQDSEEAAEMFGKMLVQYCLYDQSEKMTRAIFDDSIVFQPKSEGSSAITFLVQSNAVLEPFVGTLSDAEKIAFYRRALAVDQLYVPIQGADYEWWFLHENALANLLLEHHDVSGAIEVYRSAMNAWRNSARVDKQFFVARNKLAIASLQGSDRNKIDPWQTEYVNYCRTNSIDLLVNTARKAPP